MVANPYFSIVIPVYNREREVCRAVDSCLSQSFANFEVVVVDDGSADGTASVIRKYADPRVRLICHSANRGVCPARNSGVLASVAPWIIFLDSDHEIRPGCLARISEVTNTADASIDRFGFMYDFDDGRISPSPLPPDRILGYLDWLRWIEIVGLSDALWVTRRRCFDVCMMPESFALEFSYFLDFAKAFRSKVVGERLAVEHTDSNNRITLSWLSPGLGGCRRRKLLDQIDDWTNLLSNHGKALAKHAPQRYQGVLRNRAMNHILAGQKLRGIEEAAALVRSYPRSFKNWASLLLTLFGSHSIQWAMAYTRRCGQRITRHNGSHAHTFEA